jgi:hypothetical protein
VSRQQLVEEAVGIEARQPAGAASERLLDELLARHGRTAWPNDFTRPTLQRKLAAYERDAHLSLLGRVAVLDQLRRALDNGLRLQAIIDRHPQILDEPIERPLFIIGQPRTGTTLLQRLMALHAGARSLPYWEALFPAPLLQGPDEVMAGRPDPRDIAHRRRLTLRARQLAGWLAPDFDRIHPMSVDGQEECLFLLRLNVLMPPEIDFAYLPSYWQWLRGADMKPAYRVFRQYLQVLQWLRPREHWLLKSPIHLSALPALLEAFPDARIVHPHRDLAAVVPSLCSLFAAMWGGLASPLDPHDVGRYVLDGMRRAPVIAAAAEAQLPAGRLAHVEFEALMQDPVGVTLGLYDRLGYRHDPALEAKMNAWMRDNPRDKHGHHDYRLADFGLTEADLAGLVR